MEIRCLKQLTRDLHITNVREFQRIQNEPDARNAKAFLDQIAIGFC